MLILSIICFISLYCVLLTSWRITAEGLGIGPVSMPQFLGYCSCPWTLLSSHTFRETDMGPIIIDQIVASMCVYVCGSFSTARTASRSNQIWSLFHVSLRTSLCLLSVLYFPIRKHKRSLTKRESRCNSLRWWRVSLISRIVLWF